MQRDDADGMPTARVEAIWLKRMKRGPMDAVLAAVLEENSGLRGNANRGGWRQVTLLEREAWETATTSLGIQLDPSCRRANLLLSGVRLEKTRGRILRVGRCRIEIRGETTPCERMEELHPGLKSALAVGWRGGAFGVVLEGGTLTVDDAVEWEPLGEH